MIPNIQHKLKGKVLLIAILGGLALVFNIYILYKASISENDIISVGLVAFFAGLLCESFRVLDHWKTVALVFLIAYVLSFMAFVPRENENTYFLEGRISLWPYYGLNYNYQVVPRHTMIWFLFFTFPLMINLINLAHRPLSAIRES